MTGDDSSAMRSKEYFRLPNIFSLILVPFGLGLLTACTFCPGYVPYDLLGPLGWLAKYMVGLPYSILDGIFYVSFLIHVGEAYAAGRVALSKGLTDGTAWKWRYLVFLYGVFAFKYLICYDPTKEEEREKTE